MARPTRAALCRYNESVGEVAARCPPIDAESVAVNPLALAQNRGFQAAAGSRN